MKLCKPEKSYLDHLKREALDGQTLSQWKARLLGSVADILRRDPLQYRSYGPYWWVQKRALIDAGYSLFGSSVDQEGFSLCDYGDEASNMLAAWTYRDYAFGAGLIYSSCHNVTFVPESEGEGEPDLREYVVADDEMELLGAVNA